MDNNKKKRKPGKVIGIILLFLFLIALGIGAGLLVANIFGAKDRHALEAFYAEGAAKAFTVAMPQDPGDEAALRDYYAEAIAYGEQNGFNTMIVSVKDDGTVLWRDENFPVAADVSAKDSFFSKYDPLAVLFEEAEGKGIQVWLQVTPFEVGGVTGEMKGKAADMASSLVGGGAVSSEEYLGLLTDSLSALPQKYPLAGVVLNARVDEEKGTDSMAWRQAVETVMSGVQSRFEGIGSKAAVALSFGENSLLVDAAYAGGLVASGAADCLLTPVSDSADVGKKLAAFGNTAGSLMVEEQDTDTSGRVLFTAATRLNFRGALLAAYPAAQTDAARLGFLQSAMAPVDGTLPTGFDIPHTLQINYPLESDTIGSGQTQVFIMGNSDPAQDLLLNHEAVARTTENGVFGVLVDLAVGENTFVFQQGNTTVDYTITRPEPSGGGGAGAAITHDGTVAAQPGQAVQIASAFTGALYDPSGDKFINETYYQGATAIVQESMETVRWYSGANHRTEIYKLTSGDYVLAYDCQWISGGKSAFTGLTAEPDDRGEWLSFTGDGTPAVNMSCANGVLRIEMYDTTFNLPEGFSSALVKSANVEAIAGGVALNLDVGTNVWGYTVDYSTGGTRVFLKSAPTLSGDAAKPLSGVRVMLDPGHGADDAGAAGIMGRDNGPNEKDCNLAQAQAIAYRLRQMGAEVIMGRDDDSFTTTQERLAALMDAKPDIFISVHHNSAELTADHNGTEGAQVYYYSDADNSSPQSKQLGQLLMDGVAAETGRAPSEPGWGYYNVLRTTVCPAVLFEFGFMISPAEFENVTSADGLYGAACGAAEGVLRMVENAGGTAGAAAGSEAQIG